MSALRAEWTKLHTVPGTVWLVLGLVALTAGVSVATMAATGGAVADPAKSSLIGITLGQAVVAILAVLVVGGEYSTRLMHTTLAAMPRRRLVLAAKAAVVTAAVLVAGTLAVTACIVAGRLMLVWHGPFLRAAAGSVLYLALIGLLSMGTAMAVRDSAAAIGVVLGLLYVVPIVTQAVSDPVWQRHMLQIAPMTAGLAIQASTGLDTLPIGPWAGLAVLAAWAGGALVIGGLLFVWRDA